MSDQLRFVVEHLTDLLWGVPNNRPGGLVMTLLLSVGGLGFGFTLAIVVSAAHLTRWRLLRAVARNYIRIVRGIPVILVLLLVHRVIAISLGAASAIGSQSASLLSALVALTLYSSAYQADIINSGLRAVPREIVEDARLLGASPLQCYLRVQLPFGLRVMQPAMLSQVITLFKDSSVVVVLGVADLTTTARIVPRCRCGEHAILGCNLPGRRGAVLRGFVRVVSPGHTFRGRSSTPRARCFSGTDPRSETPSSVPSRPGLGSAHGRGREIKQLITDAARGTIDF